MLIEHTAGHFPLWLTPDQVAILPISEKFNDYAKKVARYFDDNGVRATIDDRNEKIGRRFVITKSNAFLIWLSLVKKKLPTDLFQCVNRVVENRQTMSMEEFASRINAEVAKMLESTNIQPKD